MISAHLNGQNFASIGICPYCWMGKEGTHIFSLLTLFGLKVAQRNGQITPNTVTRPCKFKSLTIIPLLSFRGPSLHSSPKEMQNGFIHFSWIPGSMSCDPRSWCLFEMTQGHMILTLDSRKNIVHRDSMLCNPWACSPHTVCL